jgi:hypothetical protein
MKSLFSRFTLALVAAIILSSAPPVAHSATNWEVSSAADDGPGTLRQVLRGAAAGDTISFNTTDFPIGNPVAIELLSALPAITQADLRIDATGAGVILDGSQLPRSADVNGLTISASGCVIRGLTIQKFPRNNGAGSRGNGIAITAGASNNIIGGNHEAGQGNLIVENVGDGIAIDGAGATNNTLIGNHIGADSAGVGTRPNQRNGVAILNGASGNTIGGIGPGERNLIGGNLQNGVWIAQPGTTGNVVIGNYIGARADGMGPLDNRLAGVGIHNGASNNRIGGRGPAERNLISGNQQNGVDIRDPGTNGNSVLGNFIGTNKDGTAQIGGFLNGVLISNAAVGNQIGDNTAGGGNLISGNQDDGVCIQGAATAFNIVQGNTIGLSLDGTAAIPNGQHGVEIRLGAHDNLIGGDRSNSQGNPLGQGNSLSGNLNHGLVIHFDAHDNTASGNLVGPNINGQALPEPASHSGIDIAQGAHDNTIQANIVSGNQTDGIAVFDSTGRGTINNKILNNLVGLTGDGRPLGNHGVGIASIEGARGTTIQGNIVAFNYGYGIWVAPCTSASIDNPVTQNSVYSNTLGGLLTSCTMPAPSLRLISAGTNERVSGTASPGTHIEIFSDYGAQGRYYEGTTDTDPSGNFTFAAPSGSFTAPNITATSRDANGNTSAFSQPAHALWTMLLYLNGDNDLSQAMFDTVDSLIASGPSQYANVLALVDGYSGSRRGTVLYELSYGRATVLDVPSVTTGERNMGDGQTLIDFVTWARTNYPARHSMLSILDHGGGWAPSTNDFIPGATPHRRGWLAGNSGLSWDFNPGAGFSEDYDYLDSPEIGQALASITNSGASKLDVLFYDVCLMGMLEVAYQIKDYASYFVSSQNIGWAPDGDQNRYVRTIQGLQPATDGRAMASLLVRSYAESLPPVGHPFTISAVDTSQLASIANATNQLALALSQRVTNQASAARLKSAYNAAQKIDYDADFFIEPNTDGFVDLYDFALQIAQQFTSDQVVTQHANTIIAGLNTGVITEQHTLVNGSPWVYPDRIWSLDRVHGLSIFLPLGEDLLLEVPSAQALAAPAEAAAVNLPLRDTYTGSQLSYVGATKWKDLIDTYYNIVATPVPTSTAGGPIDGLLPPDILPPQTIITVTSTVTDSQSVFPRGAAITISWAATDSQLGVDGSVIAGSGVTGADIWHYPPGGPWKPVPQDPTQGGSSGTYSFILNAPCNYRFAVRAIDRIGNREPLEHGANLASIYSVVCPVYLPVFRR